MIKDDPDKLIDENKSRVQTINYLETEERSDYEFL